MKEETDDSWFSEHLFSPHEWHPERMGPKRVIFSRPAGSTLLSMALDPSPAPPTWRILPGKSYTESLFELLWPVVEMDSCVVHLLYPDGAWIEMIGQWRVDKDSWSHWILNFFEESPADQGGPQMLVVLLRGRRGILSFERAENLDIAYYGPDDLWEEICAAIYDRDIHGLRLPENLKGWNRKGFVEDTNLCYEKLGPKRLIFSGGSKRAIGEIFIESSPVPERGWAALGDLSQTQSFFERLRPFVERHECVMFFVSMPQQEYTGVHWVRPVVSEEWSFRLLNSFELFAWECGWLSLGVLIDGDDGLIDISIRDGFEIAFYGPESLWDEISHDLWKE